MVNKTLVTYTTLGVVAASTIAGLAYVAWWDHKRRNDAQFRKKLRKEQKKMSRHAKLADEKAKAQRAEDLKASLELIKAEPVPTTSEERETYFMQHVGTGEQLSAQGPAFHINAALSFYRALRVYPSPVELIMIYQKTVPEPIFKIIMELTSMDVSDPTGVLTDLGVDDDAPTKLPASSSTRRGGRRSATTSSGASGDERTGPPSETSDWETLTDPGSGASATVTPPRA